MKYKSEIGESMEKPSKKLKRILLIVGITGVVYASFKYLLPLVIPFFIAYALALALYPSSSWLEKKLQFHIGKKKIRIPKGVIGGIELVFILAVLGFGIYTGGRRLCMEARLFIDNLPEIIESLDIWLTGFCFWAEDVLKLKQGYLVMLLRESLINAGRTVKETAMPLLWGNSMVILKWVVQCSILTVILLVGTMMSIQEMESMKERRKKSVFSQEFTLLSNRLLLVGNAYLKTQATIMILTMIICIWGFLFMGNPYNILLGIGIGLLDALPLFGTGTVLIPWTLFCFVSGNAGKGFALLAIYIICYLMREFLEAKMMGDKVGLSPLETLAAIYVGLKLFGLVGVILGPIGLLIIEDMVQNYADD